MAPKEIQPGREAKKSPNPSNGRFGLFMNLPNELKYEVVSKAQYKDLPNLCRASKLVCTITTPYLYRDITIASEGIARLTRTLLDRPELAKHTVSLEIFTELGAYIVLMKHVNLHPQMVADMLENRYKEHHHRPKDFVRRLVKVLLRSFQGLKLKTLTISFEGRFEFCDVKVEYPRLANLHLRSSSNDVPTQLGRDLQVWIDHTAPNLQDLSLTNVVTCSNHLSRRFKNVKSLHFNGHRAGLVECRHMFPDQKKLENITLLDIEDEVLRSSNPPTIIYCCTRLEDFRLAYANPDFHLPTLVEHLGFARGTLRSIRIDPLDFENGPSNVGKPLTSLRYFTKLKTLRIPASFFFVKYNVKEALEFLLSLPPSLETLEIYTEYENIDPVLEKFEEWAQNFPNLHYIDLIHKRRNRSKR